MLNDYCMLDASKKCDHPITDYKNCLELKLYNSGAEVIKLTRKNADLDKKVKLYDDILLKILGIVGSALEPVENTDKLVDEWYSKTRDEIDILKKQLLIVQDHKLDCKEIVKDLWDKQSDNDRFEKFWMYFQESSLYRSVLNKLPIKDIVKMLENSK